MNTITIGRSTYNKWIRALYNQENLPPRFFFIPEKYPRLSLIKKDRLALPPRRTLNEEIYFDKTPTGWRCSVKLIIINDIPCPVLPYSYQADIREGYSTIEELTERELAPKVNVQMVIRAALAELELRRSQSN